MRGIVFISLFISLFWFRLFLSHDKLTTRYQNKFMLNINTFILFARIFTLFTGV